MKALEVDRGGVFWGRFERVGGVELCDEGGDVEAGDFVGEGEAGVEGVDSLNEAGFDLLPDFLDLFGGEGLFLELELEVDPLGAELAPDEACAGVWDLNGGGSVAGAGEGKGAVVVVEYIDVIKGAPDIEEDSVGVVSPF